MFVEDAVFTMRPDGSQTRQTGFGWCPSLSLPNGPDLSTIIGATTTDPYAPTNGIRVRLADDRDAVQWRYERGLFPTLIIDGVKDDGSDTGNNVRKSTPNAGYRNQIIATFADGSTRAITNSPTVEYQVAISPDGVGSG